MLLQKEPFLTMFYNINSSPMFVTKSVFKLIIVLSNYQKCTFPLIKVNNMLVFDKMDPIFLKKKKKKRNPTQKA